MTEQEQMPMQNSMFLQCSRADSVEYITGGDAVGNPAIWTNPLNETIQVNPGDKLQISTASLNAVGNEGGSLEFNGTLTSRSTRRGTINVYDNKASIEIELYKSADGRFMDMCPNTLTTHSPPGQLFTYGSNYCYTVINTNQSGQLASNTIDATKVDQGNLGIRTARYNPAQYDGSKYTFCELKKKPLTYNGFELLTGETFDRGPLPRQIIAAADEQTYRPIKQSNGGGYLLTTASPYRTALPLVMNNRGTWRTRIQSNFIEGTKTRAVGHLHRPPADSISASVAVGGTFWDETTRDTIVGKSELIEAGFDGAFSLTKEFSIIKKYIELEIPAGYTSQNAVANYITQQLNKTEDIEFINPDLTDRGFSWAKDRREDVISASLQSSAFFKVPAVPMIDMYNAKNDYQLYETVKARHGDRGLPFFMNTETGIFGNVIFNDSVTNPANPNGGGVKQVGAYGALNFWTDNTMNNKSMYNFLNQNNILTEPQNSAEHIVYIPYAWRATNTEQAVAAGPMKYPLITPAGYGNIGRQFQQFNKEVPKEADGPAATYGFWNNGDIVDGVNRFETSGLGDPCQFTEGTDELGQSGTMDAQKGICGQVLAGEGIFTANPWGANKDAVGFDEEKYMVHPNSFFDSTTNEYDYMKNPMIVNPELVRTAQQLYMCIYFTQQYNYTATEATLAFNQTKGLPAVANLSGTSCGGTMRTNNAGTTEFIDEAQYNLGTPTTINDIGGSYEWGATAFVDADDPIDCEVVVISAASTLGSFDNGDAVPSSANIGFNKFNRSQNGNALIAGLTGDFETTDVFMVTSMEWDDYIEHFKEAVDNYIQAQENATTGFMRKSASTNNLTVTYNNPAKKPTRAIIHIERPTTDPTVTASSERRDDFIGYDYQNGFAEGTYTPDAREGGGAAVAQTDQINYWGEWSNARARGTRIIKGRELTYQHIHYDYDNRNTNNTEKMKGIPNPAISFLLTEGGASLIPLVTNGYAYKSLDKSGNGKSYLTFRLKAGDPMYDGFLTYSEATVAAATLRTKISNIGYNNQLKGAAQLIGWSPSFKGIFNMTSTLNNGCPTWSERDITVKGGAAADAFKFPASELEVPVDVPDPYYKNIPEQLMPPLPSNKSGNEIGFIMLGSNNPECIYSDIEGRYSFKNLHTPLMLTNPYDAGDASTDTSAGVGISGSMTILTNSDATIWRGINNYDGPAVNVANQVQGAGPRMTGNPYNSEGQTTPNSEAGEAYYTLQLNPQENNFGTNYDLGPVASKSTRLGYIQDSQSGVFLTNFGQGDATTFESIGREVFEGSLWDKLGFTYDNLHLTSGNRNTRPRDLRNNNQFFTSNPLTTGANILGSDMIKFATGRMNEPLFTLALPRISGAGGSLVEGNTPTGAYPENYTQGTPKIKTESTGLIAFNYPNKSDNPYFLICSDLLNGQSNYTGGRSSGKMNVLGTVQKYFSGSDYFYGSTGLGEGITFTSPMALSSIQTTIRNPNGQVCGSLSGRSMVVYKLDRVTPIPLPPLNPAVQSGDTFTGSINPLEDIVRSQIEGLSGISPQDPLSEKENTDVGIEMGEALYDGDQLDIIATTRFVMPAVAEEAAARMRRVRLHQQLQDEPQDEINRLDPALAMDVTDVPQHPETEREDAFYDAGLDMMQEEIGEGYPEYAPDTPEIESGGEVAAGKPSIKSSVFSGMTPPGTKFGYAPGSMDTRPPSGLRSEEGGATPRREGGGTVFTAESTLGRAKLSEGSEGFEDA